MTEEQWEAAKGEEGSLVQEKSGNFMWTYFVISWIMMGTSCVCGCLMPCLMACLNK